MVRPRNLLLSLLLFAALSLVPAVTRAWDGPCLGSWLAAPGFGSGGSLYGLGYVPVPPYYALHPPVYYGERYYRSYGESPFARVDHSSRPVRIRAQVIINPFVQAPAGAAVAPADPQPQGTETEANAKTNAKTRTDQMTAVPQMIVNPYYVSEAKVASHQ